MILTAAGKMTFRYNGARIIYAIFTDVENFEMGFIIVGKYLDTQIEYQFYFANFHS